MVQHILQLGRQKSDCSVTCTQGLCNCIFRWWIPNIRWACLLILLLFFPLVIISPYNSQVVINSPKWHPHINSKHGPSILKCCAFPMKSCWIIFLHSHIMWIYFYRNKIVQMPYIIQGKTLSGPGWTKGDGNPSLSNGNPIIKVPWSRDYARKCKKFHKFIGPYIIFSLRWMGLNAWYTK
jgi:hypothetical protein